MELKPRKEGGPIKYSTVNLTTHFSDTTLIKIKIKNRKTLSYNEFLKFQMVIDFIQSAIIERYTTGKGLQLVGKSQPFS